MITQMRAFAHATALPAAAFGLLALAGCNTIEGAGQDISSAGRGIERAADGDVDVDGAYTTQRVNMRSGPSRDFAEVDVIRRGASVRVHGCLTRRDWCDVSWGGNRGWVSANYINFRNDGRRISLRDYDSRGKVQTVRFNYTYWELNYTLRPWYLDRVLFERRYRAQD